MLNPYESKPWILKTGMLLRPIPHSWIGGAGITGHSRNMQIQQVLNMNVMTPFHEPARHSSE
eukprot:10184684-Karenia_brevis.AAC.1